jgi:diacylglycerol O-acyltransferase
LAATSTRGDNAVIERASPNDMMELAADVGPLPMQVGALLTFEAPLDVDAALEQLAVRVRSVPRLRQRLTRTPLGCGRPIWVDDAAFDDRAHIRRLVCPAPGDEAALLACATELVGSRLPGGRPPWAATLVTGLERGRTALVIVFDHVLADGIGGLAVLANLVDGMAQPVDNGFPRPAPSALALARDAASHRWQAMARWREGIAHVRSAVAELQPGLRSAAPRTSLNRPTGSRRATRVVRADLAAIRSVAHAHDATVNDVVLAAVTGALRALLLARGEDADRFVVSIPISARRSASSEQLGNEVGVLPVELPASGELGSRLDEIAHITRARKAADATRGSSATLVGPMFRVLGRLGLLRRFIERQRLINTLVTNLRGPDEQLSFAGTAIAEVIPISIVTGNVTVAFAVLSYAGSLTVTINSDADACPDVDTLSNLLQGSLNSSITPASPRRTADPSSAPVGHGRSGPPAVVDDGRQGVRGNS